MNKIIPSTKLKIVSVHKLMDATCLRKFFWRRILNLESKGMNENFWYGGVLGAGFEAMLVGKNWRQAMKKEDKRRVKGHELSSVVQDNLDLNYRLIEVILAGAARQPEVKRMRLTRSQIKFSVPLKCGVKFCGTLDGIGTYRGQPHLFEFKTASKVNQAYLMSLRFDKQINGYAWAINKGRAKPLTECRYCIFKKAQKRVKRGQTVDEFVEEIEQDVIARPEMYYVWHRLSLGRTTVREVAYDIKQEAEDLKAKFDRAKRGQLLDPHYWPKRENKCHDYSGCEFLPLCDNPAKWKIYLRMYRQREMLYEEEKDELES